MQGCKGTHARSGNLLVTLVAWPDSKEHTIDFVRKGYIGIENVAGGEPAGPWEKDLRTSWQFASFRGLTTGART